MRNFSAAVAATVLTTTGCSLSTQPLSYGLNSQPAVTGYSQRPDGGFATKPMPKTSRAASLRNSAAHDAARAGTVTDAAKGALSDRDHGAVSLNVTKAQTLINAYRRKHGLKPLRVDALLTAAAKAHARDLAKWDRISHFGSDGSNPWDRVKRAGYTARLAAENVGTGQASLEEVLAGWKKSPGHNKNLLLRDARHMGIALVHARDSEFKTFWTLVLGARF